MGKALKKKLKMATSASDSRQQSVVIGTRESQLAMWQALHVQSVLRNIFPTYHIEVKGMKTYGDKVLNKPLSAFSNKGVFTKELDIALLNRNIDIAVHCVKDLPTVLPEGLAMAAILERGDTQ